MCLSYLLTTIVHQGKIEIEPNLMLVADCHCYITCCVGFMLHVCGAVLRGAVLCRSCLLRCLCLRDCWICVVGECALEEEARLGGAGYRQLDRSKEYWIMDMESA